MSKFFSVLMVLVVLYAFSGMTTAAVGNSVTPQKVADAAAKAWEFYNLLALQYQIYHIAVCAAFLIWFVVASICIKKSWKKLFTWGRQSDDHMIGAVCTVIFIYAPTLIVPLACFFHYLEGACMPHIALAKEILQSVGH